MKDALPQTAAELTEWVRDARERTLALVADLTDEELHGPRLPITNPFLWEIGHVAWFQERWVLREARGEPPLPAGVDSVWDSSVVEHDTRWDLPLTRSDTLQYVHEVTERVLEGLVAREPDERERYFVLLTVFHEDMHAEAFTYMRQTLGYARPALPELAVSSPAAFGGARGDVSFEGGTFELGARESDGFVFDNEKWGHAVQVQPFAMSRTAVTQAEFLEFVEERDAEAPAYWKKEGGTWLRRDFDRWVALEPDLPVVHVSWEQARAYCAWKGRRLPTEAEWELAACAGGEKRRQPWGSEPASARAHVDGRSGGVVCVDAYAEGDCPRGCRQLVGNVWEWTASTFEPYPGFVKDPYEDYSAPWFHSRKVLRGGAWATRGRMLRNTWRNYFEPHRRDVYAGFRTCPTS